MHEFKQFLYKEIFCDIQNTAIKVKVGVISLFFCFFTDSKQYKACKLELDTITFGTMHRGHTWHDYPWPWVSLAWHEY